MLSAIGLIGYPALFIGGAATILVAGGSYHWVERHFLAHKRYPSATPKPMLSRVEFGGIETPTEGVVVVRPTEAAG